jgi:hypothetical protein
MPPKIKLIDVFKPKDNGMVAHRLQSCGGHCAARGNRVSRARRQRRQER